MLTKGFPLEKSDIQYDPDKQEVTLKREKFDAMIEFMRALVEQVEAAEDQKDIESYRARRAEASADVLTSFLSLAKEAGECVERWVDSPEHSIRELSQRAGVPYATCHRIITERLKTDKIEIGRLAKLLKVVEADDVRSGS